MLNVNPPWLMFARKLQWGCDRSSEAKFTTVKKPSRIFENDRKPGERDANEPLHCLRRSAERLVRHLGVYCRGQY